FTRSRWNARARRRCSSCPSSPENTASTPRAWKARARSPTLKSNSAWRRPARASEPAFAGLAVPLGLAHAQLGRAQSNLKARKAAQGVVQLALRGGQKLKGLNAV